MINKVKIFIDGSCLGNPGPGGYGVIVNYKNKRRFFSSGYILTTNNRMEIMAAIIALEYLKIPCVVTVFTDSLYLREGITKWIYRWKQCGWQTRGKKPVKNIDLWKRLDDILKLHQIQWKWIKSHSGLLENEFCDELARLAANNPVLDDVGYIKCIERT